MIIGWMTACTYIKHDPGLHACNKLCGQHKANTQARQGAVLPFCTPKLVLSLWLAPVVPVAFSLLMQQMK